MAQTTKLSLEKLKRGMREHLLRDKKISFFNTKVDYVPTGIEPLDLILGEEGIPIGRVTQIIGRPGSGKSALAINIMAHLQRLNKDTICYYFDSERSTDILRLRNLGMTKTDDVVIVNFDLETFYEKIIDMIDYKKTYKMELKKLEKTPKSKKDETIENNIKIIKDFLELPVIVVLDSMPFTKPKKLMEVDDPSQVTGLVARINQHYLQKILDDLVNYNIILIILNQLRDNIQMGFIKQSGDLKALGTEKAIPGGKHLKYATYTMLYLIERKGLKREKYGFDGNLVEISTWKCKSFTPYLSVKIPFSFIYGYDNFHAKLYFLLDKNYIKSSGSTYKFKYYKNGEKGFYFKKAKDLYEEDKDFKEAFDKIWEDAKRDFIYEYRDVFLAQEKTELVEKVKKEKDKVGIHEGVDLNFKADLSEEFVEMLEESEENKK